jgi:hypothetical protein
MINLNSLKTSATAERNYTGVIKEQTHGKIQLRALFEHFRALFM